MRLHIIIFIYLTLLTNLSYSQSQSQIDSLLKELEDKKNSKSLTIQPEAKKIINYGDKALALLARRFPDTTFTKINSECQDRTLTKGEIAIILADRIESMPYFLLTHIQNCTLEFCKDNPNIIEYYLFAIRRDNVEKFKGRYIDWLKSKDRKKWSPYLANKKKKQKMSNTNKVLP